MGKEKKIQESWKKKYDWVTNSTKSVYVAVCLACNGKDLNIKSGALTLDRHARTDLHDSNYKKWKTQSLFVVVDNHATIINSLLKYGFQPFASSCDKGESLPI